jgi:hypothetical protein
MSMPWDGALNLWGTAMSNNTLTDAIQKGTVSKKRNLSQEAIDKLIYDVMSSDQGLAQLAAGQNLAGGHSSSTKTLQTQDFLTKLIGELAIVTAEEVQSTDMVSETEKSTKEGRALNGFADKVGTVICTELALQGYLDPDLYEAGGPPSRQVSETTWIGYRSWADHVVPRMKKSPRLCKFLLPIVESRYRYLLDPNSIELLGRLSVHIGHPICYLIGAVINLWNRHGRISQSA